MSPSSGRVLAEALARVVSTFWVELSRPEVRGALHAATAGADVTATVRTLLMSSLVSRAAWSGALEGGDPTTYLRSIAGELQSQLPGFEQDRFVSTAMAELEAVRRAHERSEVRDDPQTRAPVTVRALVSRHGHAFLGSEPLAYIRSVVRAGAQSLPSGGTAAGREGLAEIYSALWGLSSDEGVAASLETSTPASPQDLRYLESAASEGFGDETQQMVTDLLQAEQITLAQAKAVEKALNVFRFQYHEALKALRDLPATGT